MIGLILSGHGNFATGLNSSLELIAGKQEKFIPVDFTIDDTSETLKVKMEKAIEELSDCEGVLFLTDIVGGSPFKTAALLGTEKDNIGVVAGTNLGMLLEVSLCREGVTVEDLKNSAIESAKNAIKAYENKSRKQACSSGI